MGSYPISGRINKDLRSMSSESKLDTLDTLGHTPTHSPGVYSHTLPVGSHPNANSRKAETTATLTPNGQQGSCTPSSPAVPPISSIDKEIGLEKGIDTEFEYRVICRFCHCDE